VNPQPLKARLAHLEGAFVQVGERLNSIGHRLDTIEQVMQSRFGQLEQVLVSRFALVDQRFGAMDQRFATIDQRFVRIDQRFVTIDQRFATIDQRFNWLIGLVVGTWITTILTILFHH